MKVLHIIPSISPKLGGPTQVVLNLVRSLINQGIDVEIATTNDDNGLLLDVPLSQLTEYQGLPVWFFPRNARIKDFLPSVAFTTWLWNNIKYYDILDNHYLFSYLPSCAAVISQQQNVPYTIRTMGQLAPWALAQSKTKKKVYSYLLERRNLDKATAIHCTSHGEVEDVINFGVKTPKIALPLGVNQPELIIDAGDKVRHKYNIPNQTPIILFLSRLHYKKRPELLIETLGFLAKKGYKFHLLIAGSGEDTYIRSLQEKANSVNMTQYTSFIGFVDGYEKDLVLQGSDLFILPTYSENFGIALAEAMVSGLPLITTPGVQIAPEIAAADAGIIVEGNTESLSDAIALLLDDPQKRKQMGDNGRLFAKNQYSWEIIAKQLAHVYQQLVKPKSQTR
ncbi:MAG: glycosyltransferase [Nostocales cyanobacterium]|nr:MAG: glycosyltransferase [Nostocales cyanobacterium]